MNSNSQYKRPDVVDLIGPDFDSNSPEPAGRTLLICAGPRTGSFEVCRYLAAAGIGVPHEYFLPHFAKRLALRWGIFSDPLVEPGIARYIDTLRRRRSQGGVFAVKLGFSHFDQCLRNEHGARLFEGAVVVYLFRPEVARQFASLRIAKQTGVWDFSQTFQGQPRHRQNAGETALERALFDLESLLMEDAGLRKLFVLLGIQPLFITSAELFQNASDVIHRIADNQGVPVNETALQEAIAHSRPYERKSKRQHTVPDFSSQFKELAFKKAPSS